MSKTAGSVAKTYPWQCLECKTCHVCGDPDEEDKMVCCDECDRGYHSFCVGLTSIPSGGDRITLACSAIVVSILIEGQRLKVEGHHFYMYTTLKN